MRWTLVLIKFASKSQRLKLEISYQFKQNSWQRQWGYSSVVEHSTADREVTGSTPVAPCLLVTESPIWRGWLSYRCEELQKHFVSHIYVFIRSTLNMPRRHNGHPPMHVLLWWWPRAFFILNTDGFICMFFRIRIVHLQRRLGRTGSNEIPWGKHTKSEVLARFELATFCV